MNFFGHATIALWSADDPAHVFGSMLPDFAGMVGTRIAGALEHPELQGGIDLHHRTDDAFHGAPVGAAIGPTPVGRWRVVVSHHSVNERGANDDVTMEVLPAVGRPFWRVYGGQEWNTE